jgi:quercetin dioxygenase-like cupin family protein
MPCLTSRAAISVRKNRGDRRDRKEQQTWFFLCALCVLCGFFRIPLLGQEPQRPVPTPVWAPKPAQTPAYPPGQKVWTKLTDLKAAHKADANWREVLVDDGRLTGEYVSAAPGTSVPKRLHPDTREWFAVVEGEIRVEIEGQAPFTATRGSVVNIPRQTIYSLETVGDKPSLRFVVNVTHAKTLFPRDTTAAPAQAPPAGSSWVPATLNRTPGQYDQFNQPTVNIHEAAKNNEKYSGGRFVRDDKSEMLIIYGYEKNLPPLDPSDKGHFHAESAEFWLVFAGRIRYAFEGQQPFVASEGDVVYVPAGTWHATRYTGADPACRLSITEYVGNALLLEPRR